MKSPVYGNEPFAWGAFEKLKLLHWSTLATAILLAAATWIVKDAAGVVSGWGGAWATAAGLLTYAAQALILYTGDNSGKKA